MFYFVFTGLWVRWFAHGMGMGMGMGMWVGMRRSCSWPGVSKSGLARPLCTTVFRRFPPYFLFYISGFHYLMNRCALPYTHRKLLRMMCKRMALCEPMGV